MKQVLAFSVLLVFLTAGKDESKRFCFPDKGIKTAITTANYKKSKKLNNPELNKTHKQQIEFNKSGQPLTIRKSSDKSEFKRKYKNGKLLYIISKTKKLPDFYLVVKKDSLLSNSNFTLDTSFVISHHMDGRPYKMMGKGSIKLIFEYENCDKVSITTINRKGDTIQQFIKTFKNGLIIETKWIPFIPTKSYIITKYYGYKLDRKGNWIKRKYKLREGLVIEKRKLTYY